MILNQDMKLALPLKKLILERRSWRRVKGKKIYFPLHCHQLLHLQQLKEMLPLTSTKSYTGKMGMSLN